MKTNIGKAINLLNDIDTSSPVVQNTLNQAITLLKHEDEARQPLVPEQPQPDKATAMPSKIQTLIEHLKILQEASPAIVHRIALDLTREIEAEHAALVAVAEVAAKIHATRADCLELTNALAQLATVRGGK